MSVASPCKSRDSVPEHSGLIAGSLLDQSAFGHDNSTKA